MVAAMGSTKPKNFLVVVISLLALFSSVMSFAKNCSDDDRYTLYFYSDSDAKVLRDQQRCDASAQSISQMECRCYEMKYQDVIKKLGEGGSPVAVATKKLSLVFNNVSCGVALDECEKACQDTQRTTANQCEPIGVAGIAAQ